MGFYDKYIVPRFINCACGTKPINRQREKVVPQASGTVLEIGIGTGLNLPHYDGSRVDKLYGLDEGYFLRSAAGELTEADRRALELPRHALHHHRLIHRCQQAWVRNAQESSGGRRRKQMTLTSLSLPLCRQRC